MLFRSLGSNLIFFGTLARVLFRWYAGRGGEESPERLTRGVMNPALALFVLWTGSVLVVLPATYGWLLDRTEVEQFKQQLNLDAGDWLNSDTEESVQSEGGESEPL